ncbi:MAG TPA: antifreeze protein, partial [Rhodospirillaceae bacterium]|nr:antifreeze protein [Rhodospirillaceae bacterium]
ELAAPVAMLAAEKGTRGRALMFRAAAAQQTPAAKAEIIAKALSLAADHGAFAAGARLYAADIAAIPPAAELGWFAYPAARALLAAQSDAAARLWLSLARAQGLTDDGAASVAAALAPLARLAMHDEQPLAPLLAAWRKARSALPGEAGIRREQVLLGLLAALGEKVPAEDWLALLDGPAGGAAVMPRAALRELLQAAAEGRRLGETVTFALACLGDPDKADPALLAWTVSVLRHAGLEAEARAVAVEAAIASGV